MRYNPACAGTTWVIHCVLYGIQIQPRVCGDYKSKRLECYVLPDTTPRVRGLRVQIPNIMGISRYNPACAGTTPKNLWH